MKMSCFNTEEGLTWSSNSFKTVEQLNVTSPWWSIWKKLFGPHKIFFFFFSSTVTTFSSLYINGLNIQTLNTEPQVVKQFLYLGSPWKQQWDQQHQPRTIRYHHQAGKTTSLLLHVVQPNTNTLLSTTIPSLLVKFCYNNFGGLIQDPIVGLDKLI